MRSAIRLALLSLCSLTLLAGCSAPTVWSVEDSLEAQPYNADWSRAHNLTGLFHAEPERIEDSWYDSDVFRNRVTNIFKDDRLRVNHFFGFLPARQANTADEAVQAFAEQSLEALKTLFTGEGFGVHAAQPSLSSDGSIRYSIFLEKKELDCVVPSDRKLLTTVSETATCRIDVLTSRDSATVGPYPTENGFTAVPRWAETKLQYGWRISDTRIESKVWVTAEKTPTDLLNAGRMEALSAIIRDGTYIYFLHERTGEPMIFEKGQARRFIEPRPAMEKRVERENREKNSFGKRFGDAAKGFFSPRPGSLID